MHFLETFRRLPFGTVLYKEYLSIIFYKLDKYVARDNIINIYEDLHCHILKNLCIFFTNAQFSKLNP